MWVTNGLLNRYDGKMLFSKKHLWRKNLVAWAWAIPASQLGFPGRVITLSSGQASLVTAIIQCYCSSYPAFMPFSLCRKLWNRKSEKLQHQEEHATSADLESHSRLLVNFAQKSVQAINAQFRDRPDGSSSHYLGRKEKFLLLLLVNGLFSSKATRWRYYSSKCQFESSGMYSAVVKSLLNIIFAKFTHDFWE